MENNVIIAIIMLVVLGLLGILWLFSIWWRRTLRDNLLQTRPRPRRRIIKITTRPRPIIDNDYEIRSREAERAISLPPAQPTRAGRNERKQPTATQAETPQSPEMPGGLGSPAIPVSSPVPEWRGGEPSTDWGNNGSAARSSSPMNEWSNASAPPGSPQDPARGWGGQGSSGAW